MCRSRCWLVYSTHRRYKTQNGSSMVPATAAGVAVEIGAAAAAATWETLAAVCDMRAGAGYGWSNPSSCLD
eukprot:4318092-Prymnesium_polylepis.1